MEEERANEALFPKVYCPPGPRVLDLGGNLDVNHPLNKEFMEEAARAWEEEE